MSSELETYLKSIVKYDIPWCNFMGYFNPYVDPFQHFISKNIPDFDYQAYKKYPRYNHVYDKLWVIKSQGLIGGTIDEISSEDKIPYPIFIKPRWGHKSATSKNCFKIKSYEELEKYKHIPEMMWSEFFNAKEQMTDYILLNGKIVYQITYVYSDSQKEFIEEWKYISPKNKPLVKITDWVNNNLNGFTGAVNLQYRSDKIIEVSLRLARGGAYILSTKNQYIIENINNVVDNNTWNYDYDYSDKLDFKPFYSFKCYTQIPLLYVYPQKVLDSMMKKHETMPFYEYYFEPSGKNGMVVLQFLHEDFEKGMQTKKHIETMINMAQILFMVLFICGLMLLAYNKILGIGIIIIVGLLFNTRFLNPLGVQYSQWKATKQLLFT